MVDPVIKNEGDSFSMRCDIRYVQENNLLQFVRENAVFVNENGQTSLDTPYNITVDGTEFPENMTDLRFEATLDMTGTTAVYTLTITGKISGELHYIIVYCIIYTLYHLYILYINHVNRKTISVELTQLFVLLLFLLILM